jgi:hypothetical protein
MISIARLDGFGHNKGSEVLAVECSGMSASFFAYMSIYASLDEIRLEAMSLVFTMTKLGQLTLIFRPDLCATETMPFASPWHEERSHLQFFLDKKIDQRSLVFAILDPPLLPGVRAVFPDF